MNLKFQLLLHIAVAAFTCLMVTTAYILHRADRQVKHETQITADSLGRLLELQLLRIDIGFDRPGQFPNFELWKETRSNPGLCVRFSSVNQDFTTSICHGSELPINRWPQAFERLYRLVFNPGEKVTRQITFKDQTYGSISVAPNIEMELTRAWESCLALLSLSAITIVSVCLLIFIAINQALKPAQLIVSGLEKMRQGDLSVRLPTFGLREWQQTSAAINELAASQKQLLSEHAKLTLKLITIQEEERRYLVRELHDELGQCLAAINAIAASISQTARQELPVLIPEAEKIAKINRHILDTVHSIMVRLRPAEIDELGLDGCIHGLIAEWNVQTAGKINFALQLKGNCQQLEEPLPVTLYRIIQECLTNIAKHSKATSATITLVIEANSIVLDIEDNGQILELPFPDNPGIGLIGIRERVMALGGQLKLGICKTGGFSVHVKLPTN